MNRASNANSSKGSSPFSVLIGILLFITACVGLYYLYNWLYNSKTARSTASILSGSPKDMTTEIASTKSVATYDISGIRGSSGLNYTSTFWVYISDSKGFNAADGGAPLAHLMDLSDPAGSSGGTLVFIGLNPKNGNLVVRQSTSDPADAQIGSPTALDGIINNYNIGTTYTTDNRCDIINGIEYQRWILIGVVANNRTLDVYIDGKLARSCVYKGNFKSTSETGSLRARFGYNNGGRLKGYFSKGYFYDFPVSPDLLWATYQEGPGAPFTITRFFNSIFGTENLFGLTPEGEALQRCVEEATRESE
jgi:hypothetical protein